MPSYSPAKRATAWIGYVSLVSQADTKLMKSNPTIAAGDFKVSLDGGTLNNLTTLPTVTPASGVMVKISLSIGEMTADNVTVVCVDAAGAEWCDLVFNLQPSVNNIDDLGTAAAAIKSDTSAIGAKTANLPSDPADASDIAASFTAVNTKLDTIDDFLDTEVAAIKAKTDALPADPASAATIAAAFTTTNGKIDVVDDFLDTEVAAIKAKTDNLPASPAATGDAMTLTAGERTSIADAHLNRDMSAVTVTNSRSPINALRMLRNKVSVPLGIVYAENDSTTAWTFTTTVDAAQSPIVTIDPT